MFVDWRGWLTSAGRAEAKRLGLPYRRVKEWKARIRAGRDLRGDARGRLKRALLGAD